MSQREVAVAAQAAVAAEAAARAEDERQLAEIRRRENAQIGKGALLTLQEPESFVTCKVPVSQIIDERWRFYNMGEKMERMDNMLFICEDFLYKRNSDPEISNKLNYARIQYNRSRYYKVFVQLKFI